MAGLAAKFSATSYLEVRTPPTISVSTLALIPTLVAACLLPDVHVAAVLLVAVACQGALALTEDLAPATAAADSAAAFLVAGVGRLTACCVSLLWADHFRLAAIEEVTGAALAGRPPEDALRSAARRATRPLRGHVAVGVLEGERCDLLTVVAAAGPGASRFEGLTFSRAGSLSGQVMDAPDTTLVRRLDAATMAAEPFLEDRVRGWALFVPLLCEGRCTGTLAVTGRSGSGTVRPRLRRIAESLAGTASLVILHAAAQADRKRLAVLE